MSSPSEDQMIVDSDLFDASWYVQRYPEVAMVNLDPLEHYLRFGRLLERDPGPDFSRSYYLEANPDVADAQVDPLVHYIAYGRKEGRLGVRAIEVRAEPSSASELRTFPGGRDRDENAPTIMVCAHVAGTHLFGSERSLLDILDGFRDIGCNVVVTIPGLGNPEYLAELRRRSVSVFMFKYDWWRNNGPLDDSVVREFSQLIAAERVDAVHVNTIMLREPLVAARGNRVPAVTHARELVEHDEALRDLIGLDAGAIVSAVLRNADCIIANSETTARAFQGKGVVHVVPNTVDVRRFPRRQRSEGQKLTVSLVSSNLPKKGLADFVEVAKIVHRTHPDITFQLVGPRTEHTALLEVALKRGDAPPNLVLAGYRQTPIAAIEDADIVVSLSQFQESFGRTVLEAMATGTPVVAYRWGALSELVVDGETGYLVEFRDVKGVARRITELSDDSTQLSSMGSAARARALDYGSDQYAERLADAYRQILPSWERVRSNKLVRAARASVKRHAIRRIAYFLWHFPVPSETFVLNELRILVERGFDVRVFCKQSPYKEFIPDFPIDWERVDDASHLARRLKETEREIVHSHFVYPTVTQMVWPACEQAVVPFTFIAHAQDIFRFANDEKNRIGEVGASPLCLRVFVPARFHRDFVIGRGVPANKVQINPNGVDASLYERGLLSDHSRRGHRSVCAIHRFTEKKGLELLILAGRALGQIGVSVHIYGYGELEASYVELIESFSLTNVHIHGPVRNRDEMLDVFSQHDLFAIPAVRAKDGDMDGIPTVLMEAMASGLPVMSTSISGIPDLVTDGVTGLICEPSPESIVDTVSRFYRMSAASVSAMTEAALNVIRSRFDARRLTSSLVRVWSNDVVDVFVVSWNNLPELREVVLRIIRHTRSPYHLVVCDNDSRSDVVEFLADLQAKHDNVSVIFNRRNDFVGPGTNMCLQASFGSVGIYVCGKEGFVLSDGWETSILEYMSDNPDVGLAGTLCYAPTYLTGAQYPAGISDFPRFRNKEFALANGERMFAHVQGGLFAIRREMVNRIGGFSDVVPHNYTDVEYSLYVESCGWRLGRLPNALALFNKTRPGIFSRITDSVYAVHPPRLEDLPLLDRIASRDTVFCGVCETASPAFVGEELSCSKCGSVPSDRSLYRYLSDSVLTYRRLPAVGVNVGGPLEDFWKQQFQGDILDFQALVGAIRDRGRLRFADKRIRLIYLGLEADDSIEEIMQEVVRLLSTDGVLLVRGGARVSDARMMEWGLKLVENVRYSCAVNRYDAVELRSFELSGRSTTCAS